MPRKFKMFDVEKKEWTETDSVVCEEPIRQLVGTNSELIIVTKAKANGSQNVRVYRQPVRLATIFYYFKYLLSSHNYRKPDSLLALAWTTARLRGENDAAWLEALMRKLPLNIEVRPWHGFF